MITIITAVAIAAAILMAAILFYNLGITEGYMRASEERQEDPLNEKGRTSPTQFKIINHANI